MKRVLATLIVMVMVVSLTGYMSSAATVTTASVSNEYIGFIYGSGEYYIHTTGGDLSTDSDNDLDLLYQTTSYTTIRINGEDYQFYPESLDVDDDNMSMVAKVVYDEVQVTLNLAIITNPYTSQADLVEFSYVVENLSDEDQEVGVRIMFDTMLGNNDDAPFNVPGYGDVTTVTYFEGDAIPEYWQAFDDLADPTVTAQGSLFSTDGLEPDGLLLGSWSGVNDEKWETSSTEGDSNGDSAVCVYFDPITYSPGEVNKAITYYGLSTVERTESSELSLGLSGAEQLGYSMDADGSQTYDPNPFTITAYVEALTEAVAEDVLVTLELPEGLVLETTGTDLGVSLGALNGESGMQQVAWNVRALPFYEATQVTYGVTVTSSNSESVSAERQLTIPAMEVITSEEAFLLLTSSSVTELSVYDGDYMPNPFEVTGEVLNDGGEVAENVMLTLDLPSGLSITTSSALEVAVGDLEPGETSTEVTWMVIADHVDVDEVYNISVTATGDSLEADMHSYEVLVPAMEYDQVVEEEEAAVLLLSSSSLVELALVDDAYNPNPFEVTGKVANGGDLTAENVELSLDLPTGLSVTTPSALDVAIGDLEPGEESATITWYVMADEVDVDEVYTITVMTTSDNADSDLDSYEVLVPGMAAEEEEEESSSKSRNKDYDVLAISSPSGVAEFDGTGRNFDKNDDYEVTYTILDDSYEFVEWQGGDSSGVVKRDIDLIAVFALKEVEEIVDDSTPEAGDSDFEVMNEDEEVVVVDLPSAVDEITDEVLPQTGGVPMAIFGMVGTAMLSVGVVLKKRK